tara:strand:+ start:299 stop:616 length:318 start_codon:yes stop_codon:yes gene_type:complete
LSKVENKIRPTEEIIAVNTRSAISNVSIEDISLHISFCVEKIPENTIPNIMMKFTKDMNKTNEIGFSILTNNFLICNIEIQDTIENTNNIAYIEYSFSNKLIYTR